MGIKDCHWTSAQDLVLIASSTKARASLRMRRLARALAARLQEVWEYMKTETKYQSSSPAGHVSMSGNKRHLHICDTCAGPYIKVLKLGLLVCGDVSWVFKHELLL